ncbi:Actin- protein 6 [Chamberlinius hualienensis]
MSPTCVVLDNGGYTAKVGYATQSEARIIPNCITKAKSERRRQFIGDQIDDCKDVSGLFYILPFQKGFLVNWEAQRTIWDYIFGKDVLNLNQDSGENELIITVPHFNFSSIQEGMNELLFEEYNFDSVLQTNATALSAYNFQMKNPSELCCVVVDCGYSFTHITPYYKGKKLKGSIRRIDVGGKLLTNYLKDVISYRQLHVMDETYVMNQVKEDVCYVSTEFYQDMEIAKKKGKANTIARDYVLPDYTIIKRGYIRAPGEEGAPLNQGEQTVHMTNERFAAPELLFHPSDIGIQQMGISEGIVHSINSAPEEMRPHFYKNILLTGGCTLFPGFTERVYKDVRAMCPEDYDVNVTLPKNSITYAWEGGVHYLKNPDLKRFTVTKKDYNEYGHNICFERYDV